MVVFHSISKVCDNSLPQLHEDRYRDGTVRNEQTVVQSHWDDSCCPTFFRLKSKYLFYLIRHARPGKALGAGDKNRSIESSDTVGYCSMQLLTQIGRAHV